MINIFELPIIPIIFIMSLVTAFVIKVIQDIYYDQLKSNGVEIKENTLLAPKIAFFYVYYPTIWFCEFLYWLVGLKVKKDLIELNLDKDFIEKQKEISNKDQKIEEPDYSYKLGRPSVKIDKNPIISDWFEENKSIENH